MAKQKSSQRAPSSRARAVPGRLQWLAPLLVACAGLAVYANALHGPLLLDDQRTLGENTSIRQLWPLTQVLHPPVQSPVTGRPLVNLSFAVNYALGGVAVEGYHLWNIGVHVLAALVLLGVLRRTFARTPLIGPHQDERPVSTSDRRATDWLALFCTLVWVVHPLNTEAVNYITQRTESMMGLFFLLTMYASIRALEADRIHRWDVLAGVAAFCGVASKETTLTVPLLIVLWDRVFAFPSFRAAWERRRRLYAIVAACWLLFAFFARELPFFSSNGFQEQVSRWTYLVNQGPMIVQYLKLALWPRALIFDYGTPATLSLTAAAPALAVVIALLALTCVALARVPALGFWGAWFFITLAPASSVIPIPTEVGAERRMYLPLVGVIVIVVMLVHLLLRRVTSPSLRPRIAWGLAVLTIIGLGGATVWRNRDYQTGLDIWQSVLDRRPQARAHEHLSMYLRDAGRIDESMAHLRIATPGSPNARHALASALLERGDVAESIDEFREFIRLRPNDPHIIAAREELAIALLRAGDPAGAAAQFRSIIALDPRYTRGHLGLADALMQSNDHDGATAEYREALRLQPDSVIALANLGLLLEAAEHTDEAVTMLRRALQIEPRALAPRRQLCSILLSHQRIPELETEARALLAYTPDDAEAHNLLGIALASQQRFEPAREQFAEAVRLDPKNSSARNNLGHADDALRQLRR